MKKKNIALIAGGYSGEAKVSKNGAKVVEKHIDKNRYNIYKINIAKKEWYYENGDGKRYLIDKNDFSIKLDGKKINFDCIFNVIHGTPGEDGKLQGYFELLEIPYINSNLAASSITFNKFLTNIFATYYNIKVPKTLLLRKRDVINEKEILNLGFPIIVKPNNGGSSIGMSRVDKKNDLKIAIKKAFKEDKEIILQEFIEGREITCGIIRKNGNIIALPLTEVKTSNSFFDYEAKYKKGKSEEITPAEVSFDIEIECKRQSAMLYERLDCKGMVRMDYIIKPLNRKGFELYLLDINTVPGLSEASIVPKQSLEAGISLKELYDIVINQALMTK